MIRTISLAGHEVKVENLEGQNTAIINKSGGAVYASARPNIEPDGDGVIEIPAGCHDGLYGTHGEIYLLGTGKVELRGTDYAVNFRQPSRSAGSDGGGTGEGVSQSYVDDADAVTLRSAKEYADSETTKANAAAAAAAENALNSAKGYTDAQTEKTAADIAELRTEQTALGEEIAAVRGEIPVIPESLPADGGQAETADRLAAPRTINGVAFDGSKNIEIPPQFYNKFFGTFSQNTNGWYKLLEFRLAKSTWETTVAEIEIVCPNEDNFSYAPLRFNLNLSVEKSAPYFELHGTVDVSRLADLLYVKVPNSNASTKGFLYFKKQLDYQVLNVTYRSINKNGAINNGQVAFGDGTLESDVAENGYDIINIKESASSKYKLYPDFAAASELDELKRQLTDAQLALCELYENTGV